MSVNKQNQMMNLQWERIMIPYRLSLGVGAFFIAAVVGCVAEPGDKSSSPTVQKEELTQLVEETKKVKLGKNITLEIQGKKKRVLVESEVCLREGILEQLLTRMRTKEHESILAADIDVRELHLALTLAGADAGKTVQFRPKLLAPTGTPVKVFLAYKQDGKEKRVPAQEWIRNIKTKKDFHTDWVFAGSVFIPDPLDKTKKPYYGANDGNVITVVNFESACLDVPFLSTKENDDLFFEAHTARIPPLKTPVTVILEPQAK